MLPRRGLFKQPLRVYQPRGRSFQEWLRQYPVEILPLSEPEMLFNCDTPEDLALS
ncbi:MAG: hypothetical protein V7K27_04065 [Nostoc sp.]